MRELVPAREALVGCALIAQRGEHPSAQLVIFRRQWTSGVHGFEKRSGEVEMREAVGAVLEVARDAFPIGIEELVVYVRPQSSNDCLALGATLIHRTSPLPCVHHGMASRG